MTKENKLPKITNRYIFENKKYTCVGVYFEMFRNGADFAKRYELEDFDKFKEIPEQEPTAENHIPDSRKKVDEVQEAKDINVPTKSIWKPTLISKPQLIKGSQHVMIRVPNKTIELVNYIDQGSLCGFRDLSNNDIQNRHIIEYCTLTDFVDQVQDNTDRLDKLETKLNK